MSKKKNSSLGTAIAAGSALVGAALGAAAVLLSDKKNQDKIKNTVDEVAKDAVVLGKNLKKKAVEFKKEVKSGKAALVKKVPVKTVVAKAPVKKVNPPAGGKKSPAKKAVSTKAN